jgi:hypothetical protein
MLEVKGLTKLLRGITAVDNVSFQTRRQNKHRQPRPPCIRTGSAVNAAVPGVPAHSARNASTGSTRATRRAGR